MAIAVASSFCTTSATTILRWTGGIRAAATNLLHLAINDPLCLGPMFQNLAVCGHADSFNPPTTLSRGDGETCGDDGRQRLQSDQPLLNHASVAWAATGGIVFRHRSTPRFAFRLAGELSPARSRVAGTRNTRSGPAFAGVGVLSTRLHQKIGGRDFCQPAPHLSGGGASIKRGGAELHRLRNCRLISGPAPLGATLRAAAVRTICIPNQRDGPESNRLL